MAGNRLAVTERDRRLLADVRRFGVISRDQCVRLTHFASKTRANDRLHRLTSAGYLTAITEPLARGGPRLIYTPGPELESSKAVRRRFAEASALFLQHELGMVDLRIAFEQHTEVTRYLDDDALAALRVGLMPDGFLEWMLNHAHFAAFLEYDRGTEPLSRIDQKVRAYLDLAFSGRFTRTFGRQYCCRSLKTDQGIAVLLTEN